MPILLIHRSFVLSMRFEYLRERDTPPIAIVDDVGMVLGPHETEDQLRSSAAAGDSHGWIHFVGYNRESAREVVERAAQIPGKIGCIAAPLRDLTVEFLRDVPQESSQLLFWLTDFERPYVQLRAEIARHRPFCYTHWLYRRAVPPPAALPHDIQVFLERCFIDQEVRVTIHELCGHDRSLQDRIRRRCRRLGLRSVIGVVETVTATRAAYALTEMGMSLEAAASWCGYGKAHLRDMLHKVFGTDIPALREMPIQARLDRALRYLCDGRSSGEASPTPFDLPLHPLDALAEPTSRRDRARERRGKRRNEQAE